MRTYAATDNWHAIIVHVLEGDEAWADFGMDQPNPFWSHDADAYRLCPVCVSPERPRSKDL